MSLRDLLNRAALAIDSVPDPSLSDLKLIAELRNYVITPDAELQKELTESKALVAKLREELTERELQNAADWAQRDYLAGIP